MSPRLAVVGWALAGALVAAPPDSQAQPSGGQSVGRALLVGTSVYENLAERFWLEGPANDVVLLRRLLTGHPFGFAEENVTTLAGWPADARRRPTKANIVRELGELARSARSGDRIVVYLAGHGSRQPADDDPADPEPDGLDEIYLPADVGYWNGETGRVENALVDDELRELLVPILDTGAFVWVIVDACHSGTMTRGAPPSLQRERRLPADELVPREVLDRVRAGGQPRSRGGLAPSPLVESPPRAPRLVATYAAQPGQLTHELPLPGPRDAYHGVFSYTLARVLSEAASALTYGELVERVTKRYRAGGRFDSTPMLDGAGRDHEVLGLTRWPDRPRLLLGAGSGGGTGRFVLDAGSLSGLTVGSVLSVFPPAGAEGAADPVGFVRVVEVAATESEVEPAAYAGRAPPPGERLVEGSRCAVVYVDFGELETRVALQSEPSPGTDPITHLPGQGPPAMERALAALARDPARLVRRVADPAEAEWFARMSGERILLVPAAGWSKAADSAEETEVPSRAPPQFEIAAAGEPYVIARELRDALYRIARARHLLQLAGELSGTPSEPARIALSVEMLRVDEDGRRRPLDPGEEGRVLRPGDRVAFRVTNRGRLPVDVTLLAVDSGFGITSLFPWRGSREDNRLPVGQAQVTQSFEVEPQLGAEELVAIAIRAGDRRADLSALAQPTLAAGVSRGAGQGTASPLGRLLERALYGRGTTRGLALAPLEEYSVELLTWTVRPRER